MPTRTFFGNRTEEPAEAITGEVVVLSEQTVIGEKEVNEAAALLMKYKQGKANLESRIKEDELWWELRHWEAIRKKREQGFYLIFHPAAPSVQDRSLARLYRRG